MKKRIWVASLFCLAVLVAGSASAGSTRLSIGVGIGVPFCARPYPCYHGPHWGFHYYRSYPVYVERPIYVQPAPVVVEQPVVVQPTRVVQPVYQAPPPRIEPTAAPPASVVSINQQLQQLTSPDERVRAEAVLEMGRLRAENAVDRLAATLAGDQSPVVREAAARALGLIGSPRALTALTHAAQTDSDRDVRRSAQFAVEVIQTQQRR